MTDRLLEMLQSKPLVMGDGGDGHDACRRPA